MFTSESGTKNKMNICALIITQNRKKTLFNLIQTLKQQTYKFFDTVIFDANSTDGTEEFIKPCLSPKDVYFKSEYVSKGDAFTAGVQFVCDKYDWIWVLHDDTIPQKDALKELLDGVSHTKNASFFVSSILSADNKPLRVPQISSYSLNGNPVWSEKLEHSLVRISGASLISTFINTFAIKKVGLPDNKSYTGNYSKYLSRLIREYGAAYLVGKSKVVHLKKTSAAISRVIKPKVCAIVVTHNRKAMLTLCLDALSKQNYQEFDTLIVDNASTDGTNDFIKPYLSERVIYINTGKNLGGSGGFYFGMKYAYEKGYDWLWIMDDDVVPTPTALFELMSHLKCVNTVSFLASSVYSKDNRAMNTPEISRYTTNGYRFWYDKLGDGMVRLAHATFVSLLINRQAIKKCGLPCKDYFIWGDDTEYTMRLIGKFGAAYLVGQSKVYHLRAVSSALSIHTEKDPNRIGMYYYMVRNTLLNTKTYSGEKACKKAIKNYIKDCFKIALRPRSYRRLKIKTILAAIYDFKRGRYDQVAFQNRYRLYGQEKAVIAFLGTSPLYRVMNGCFGYTVDEYNAGFSIFSAFGQIPAFVKEMELSDVHDKTEKEIRHSYLQRNLLYTDEYLVVDFVDSCNALAKFSNAESEFCLNYTHEFEQDYAEDKLKLLNEYQKLLVAPYEYPTNSVDECLMKFALAITKKYKPNRIIVVKRKIKEDEIIGDSIEKSEKLLDYLYLKFAQLVPQSRFVDLRSIPLSDEKKMRETLLPLLK